MSELLVTVVGYLLVLCVMGWIAYRRGYRQGVAEVDAVIARLHAGLTLSRSDREKHS